MNKRKISILLLSAIITTNISGLKVLATQIRDPMQISKQLTNEENYEIYPLPQSESYTKDKFTITDNVNIVIEDDIDESTRNFLMEILEENNFKSTVSKTVEKDKTNILLGIKGSGEYVDNYFNEKKIAYNNKIYDEHDAYVLKVDKKLEDKGVIAILGEHTDATFYGLASLKMIFSQLENKTIKTLQIEDFADAENRGFIEGFYGHPWSNEDRASLMEFGGEIKMTSYIFAPKDDPYHNSKWRELYPQDKLDELAELVKVGKESKCNFVWAIHPGFSMINWNDYENELKKLTDKLDQLYSIGVRQFGLFLDDISTSQSLTDREKHKKLITDVANWVKEKEGTESLIFCPPFYNKSWTGDSGKPYLETMKDLPENVEIMWTGDSVCGRVTQDALQWPKDAHGRDPYMWLNWPVNDYKNARLLLGPGEVMEPGVDNFAGIVTNPMAQAEASKISLFAVADYTWNTDAFNANESWKDSFKYITPEVAEEFNIIASHMCTPEPSGHGLTVGESEYLKDEFEAIRNKLNNEEDIKSDATNLKSEFDKIVNAVNVFSEVVQKQNFNLYDEMLPWLNCLREIGLAGSDIMQAMISEEEGNAVDAWTSYSKALKNIEDSKMFTYETINGSKLTVEAATKRIIPFINEMLSKVETKIHAKLDKTAIIKSLITSHDDKDEFEKMIDGDESTYMYIQNVQKDGDYYGLDLGNVVPVNEIDIVQGRNDNDHDRYHRSVLEYSVNGKDWTQIGDERNESRISEKNLGIEARFIRLKLVEAGVPGGKPDLWTAIREFTINGSEGKSSVFTNRDELKLLKVNVEGSNSTLSSDKEITLSKDQYLGIKLGAIKNISSIEKALNTTDLTLQVSENTSEWREISKDDKEYGSARYIRLINKTDNEVKFNLEKLKVRIAEFVEPSVTTNYGNPYEGKFDNVFDGDIDTFVWTNGNQDSGKQITVDLGGFRNINDISVWVNDGSSDFFKEGVLEISADGTNFETVHEFNNPGDITKNFPNHQVPHRYLKVDNIGGKEARYVRLRSTKSHGNWLKLYEIKVNEGEAKPENKDPNIESTHEGTEKNGIKNVIDGSIASFYTPNSDNFKGGSFSYKVSEEEKIKEIVVLQGADNISNADVSIRTSSGWKKVSKLSKSYNAIDVKYFKDIFEVKFDWISDVKPVIHEIIAVKEPSKVTVDKEKLQELIIEVQGIDKDKYTEESVAVLEEKLKKAEEILADENATTENVEKAVNELKKAKEGLLLKPEKPEVDKSKLQDLVNELKKLNKDNYTEDSVKALKEELKKANEVLDNEEATDKDVEDAIKRLKNAKANLVEKPVGPDKPADPDKPGDSSGNNANNGENGSNGNKPTEQNKPGSENNQGTNNNIPATGGMVQTGVLVAGMISALSGISIIRRKRN